MPRPITCATVLPLDDFARARAVAESAEALGFRAVAAEDHFSMRAMDRNPCDPRMECFTLLSALAPLTRSVMLTQIVTATPFGTRGCWRRSSRRCITP